MSISTFNLSQSGLPEVKFVKEFEPGFNNRCFLFNSAAGEKFVFRQKKFFEGYGKLDREAQVMRFLETMGIEFMPKSTFFDAEQNLHIITYVEGDGIRPRDFTPALAQLFAKQLAELHAIPHQAYVEWCRNEGLEDPSVEGLDGFKSWLQKASKLIDEQCPDRRLAQWINLNVARGLALIPETNENLKVFAHGDLGGNMQWDGKNMPFIDWECAGLRETPELGYIFIHGEVPAEIRTIILDEYCKERGFEPQQEKDFRNWTDTEMMLQKIDKVLYRAWRYSQAADSDPAEAQEFRDRAYEVLEAEFGGLKLPNLNAAPTPAPEAKPF